MIHVDSEFYKNCAMAISEDIQKWQPDELVCIMRGGMSLCHLISRELKLPVGVYYPHDNFLYLTNKQAKKVVFIEDMISRGKTYNQLCSFMENNKIDWKFAAFMIDGKIEYGNLKDNGSHILSISLKTNHWIVAPYDRVENVPEGLMRYSRDVLYKENEQHG